MSKSNNEKFFKKLKQNWISRYRVRILLVLSFVAFLAIVFIDVAVFRGLSSYIQEDSQNETRDVLKNINDSYENQLMQYRSQTQLLYRNLNVKAFLLSNGAETSHIDSIYESMRAVSGNLTGITSVILFNKENMLASYDTGMVTTTAKENIVNQVLSTSTDKDVLFASPDDRNSKEKMILFCTDRDILYGSSDYGVILLLNIDEIQKLVLPPKREIDNPIYMFYENGKMIASQNNDYNKEIQRIANAIIVKNEKQASYYVDVNGNKKAIHYVWTEDGRFFSVRIQDFLYSLEQLERALRTIILSTVLAILVIMVVVWILSGWMYRPLGKIFVDILSMAQFETDDNQGKNELLLATDALQDVNKNMILQKNKIRSNALIRFLMEGITEEGISEAEIVEKMFDFGNCHPNHFFLTVFRYEMEDWTKNEALMIYLNETSPATQYHKEGSQHCYRAGQGEILILYYIEGETPIDMDQMSETMGQFLIQLQSLYKLTGCMGSSYCNNIKNLPKAYQEGKLLTGYHILSKEILITTSNSLRKKRHGAVLEPEKEKILQYVKGNTQEPIEGNVSSLLQNLIEFRIDEAQKYLKQLVADVIHLSESVGVDKNTLYEVYLSDFLNNQIFIDRVDIKEWLCQLFVQVHEQLKDGRQSASSRLLDDILMYVEEHYTNRDLSVELVADKYNFSVSYFSKLFNHHTEKTFPDYINQKRLQKAKELLLEESNCTIQDIALKVGFNSSSYFSAAFRKYYGISPSQIRKLKKR